MPQNVQAAAAQLADHFGQAVQIGGGFGFEHIRAGQRFAADQGAGDVGFDKFLERVLGVTGIVQIGVVAQAGSQRLGQLAGFS